MTTAIYREFPLRSPSAWSALVAFIKANAQACIGSGKPLRIIVTQDEKKRNAEQNKRYWGFVLKAITEQAWIEGRQFDKDVWHEYLARRFGVCDELVMPDGEIVTHRKSTTQMTVGEFAQYMTEIEAYAATELGVQFDE